MTEDTEKKYWYDFYHDGKVVGNDNRQVNVGRTKKGIPVPDEVWTRQVDYIGDLVKINKDSVVLELCCGNGQVIGNLASKCKKAIGVDFSPKLLEQLKQQFGSQVETIHSDVMDVNFDDQSFDIVIIYDSTQHFYEHDTTLQVQRALKWLKPNGRMLIGGIPDELKKWDYISKPEYHRDYIERVLNNNPKIGSWYQPKFFAALADYFEGISVTTMDQPAYQNNSDHRFDALIKKI